MNPRGSIQSLVHWLEAGQGGGWLRVAAVLASLVALSLIVAWKQFHGPGSEVVLMQADMGRQLSEGRGFTTLVNHPQSALFIKARGRNFDAGVPYPELYHAPLYPMVVAAPLSLMPRAWTEALFSHFPAQPDGYGGDYYLLALNVLLLWVAAFQTFLLGRQLFGVRAGFLACLALLFSVAVWEQVLLVNGTLLHAVLVLGSFQVLLRIEMMFEEQQRLWLPGAALLGLFGGLLFLADYSAGAFLPVVLGYFGLRFQGRERLAGIVLALALALIVILPWLVRNVSVSGNPLGLAWQQLALKADDPTADPAVWRASYSAETPSLDPQKLGNKILTQMQENLKSRIWTGGALFMTAFFVAGLLYRFRSSPANTLRWIFVSAMLVLMLSHAAFNSGESERLPAYYLGPLVMVFGAGFFFVLVESSPSVSSWPRLSAATLLALQALPLLHDVLEPRRAHFHYPPYYPSLFVGLRQELETRGAGDRFGIMADVPAGMAWYGRQRVWSQPTRLRDFYVITLEQPIAELLLSPKVLDRPFFTELTGRRVLPRQLASEPSRFGEWGLIYLGLTTNRFPSDFPLRSPQKLAENLYVLVDPSLPALQRGK